MKAELRRGARLAGFVAVTGSLLPLFLAEDALTKSADKDRVRDAWTRRWSRSLLGLFAIRREIIGRLPPTSRGRLVVSNHRSAIDIGLLLETFGGRMLSRADLAGWPVIGVAARKTGTVFVDRAKKASGASVIRTIEELLAAGDTVCVFPEGTTFADDVVRPFQAGAFVAAKHAGAEIVPVGIVYETGSGAAFVDEPFMAHLARLAGAPPSRVKVSIGAPFDAGAKDDAKTLAKRARGDVQALVDAARAGF